MTPRPVPAVMLEHLRKLFEEGHTTYAALPEAARLAGFDCWSVLEAYVSLGRRAPLSAFFEGRLAAAAVQALRDGEERGDLIRSLELAHSLHAVDEDGCAPYSW